MEALEAREVPATLTLVVTSASDVWDRTNDATELTLREAIEDANAAALTNPGDQHTITFAENLSGQTITLGGFNPQSRSELVLEKSTIIFGPTITVQRDPASPFSHRIFDVWADTTTTIRGLTMLNGNVGGEDGGAVLSRGNLYLRDCEIRGNYAGKGGGVAALAGQLNISYCAINGNDATQGGGVFVDQRVTTTISQSTIGLNTANAQGGGIYIERSTTAAPTSVVVSGTEVVGNRAGFAGGGIYAGSGGRGGGDGPEAGGRHPDPQQRRAGPDHRHGRRGLLRPGDDHPGRGHHLLQHGGGGRRDVPGTAGVTKVGAAEYIDDSEYPAP